MELNSKLDPKNIELVKLIFRLRQDIDLFRIVALNVSGLEEHGVSKSFWPHVQMLALESIALSICKIYEFEKRNELNSIPGVISVLPGSLNDAQLARVRDFGAKFGVGVMTGQAIDYLRSCYQLACKNHAQTLDELKRYRDKFAAHSEHNVARSQLPSIAEYEAMWEFADAFYRLVSDVILDVGPSLMQRYVEAGLLRILKKLGLENPMRDFPREQA